MLMIGFPKPRARVLDRLKYKRDLADEERKCRAAVKRRDKGKCIVPGCKDAAKHLHHITFRSRGGRWLTGNIASLCVQHHQMVHAHLIAISGDADEHLLIEGETNLLKFKL